MRILTGFLVLAVCASASSDDARRDALRRAGELYQRTEYTKSLKLLAQDPAPDEATYLLTGKNYFMTGDYRKAIDFFEKALVLSPSSSESELWLGRAWGRRAETGGVAHCPFERFPSPAEF